MARKTITIGGILTAIGSIVFLLWFLSIFAPLMKDPTNPNLVQNITEDVAERIVDESIPTPVKIILGVIAIFGSGLFAVILIIALLKGWDYVMNYKISL